MFDVLNLTNWFYSGESKPEHSQAKNWFPWDIGYLTLKSMNGLKFWKIATIVLLTLKLSYLT